MDRQERCLICSEKYINQTASCQTFPILPGSEGNTYTNSQLWSLFVLKNVLDYPQQKITSLLKETYDIQLSDWFVLCSDCSEMITKAMEIYQKLLNLENRFKGFQIKAKEKILNSLLTDIQDNHKSEEMDNTLCVRTKIRQHFSIASNIDPAFNNLAIKMEPETDDCGPVQFTKTEEYDDDTNSTHSFSSNNRKSPNLNKDLKEPKDKNFYCKICTFTRLYTTRDSLMKHLWRHRNHKYPCTKCKFPCETEKALNIHLKRNLCNNSNELKCEHCTFVTVLKMDLKKHQLEMHPLSASNTSLKTKPKISRKRSKVQNSTFPRNQKKLKRIKIGKNQETFECNICSFKTKSQRSLNLHLKRHEYFENFEKIDGQLKCKLCDHLFPTRLLVIRHVRKFHSKETGMPSFSCPDCDLNFGDIHSLKCHISCVHTKQCKYFCEKCGMGFATKSVMERHISSHGNDKSFICDLCGAQLKSDNSLRMHKKKVHGSSRSNREYICKFCKNIDGKTFLNKSILNRHIREKHGNEYIYKCEICENSYLTQNSLQIHIKVKHGEDGPVECQFCQKKILNKVYLSSHHLKYCRKKPVNILKDELLK